MPADLMAELEEKYFWCEPVSPEPRSADRILAQAMDRGPFEEIRRLERKLGYDVLLGTMLRAEPMNKQELRSALPFLRDAQIVQEDEDKDTLVVLAQMPTAP